MNRGRHSKNGWWGGVKVCIQLTTDLSPRMAERGLGETGRVEVELPIPGEYISRVKCEERMEEILAGRSYL